MLMATGRMLHYFVGCSLAFSFCVAPWSLAFANDSAADGSKQAAEKVNQGQEALPNAAIAGTWYGQVSAGDTDFGATLELKQSGTDLEGCLTSKSEAGTAKHFLAGVCKDGAKEFVLHDTRVEKTAGEADWKPLPVDKYNLRLADGGASILGDAQIGDGGMMLEVELTRNELTLDRQQRTHAAFMACEKGKILMQGGKYQQAKEVYQEACKLDPNENSSVVHSDLGLCLQNSGDPEGAIAEYERAIAFEQRPETPTFNRAVCFVNSGKMDEAKVALNEFLSKFPESTKVADVKSLLDTMQQRNKALKRGHKQEKRIVKHGSKADQVAEAGKADLLNVDGDKTTGSSSWEANEAKPTQEADEQSKKKAEKPSILADDTKPVHHPRQPGTRSLLNENDDPDAKTKVVSEAMAPSSDGEADYLANVIGSGFCRWSAARLPIKIYIADGTGVRRYKPCFRDYLIKSFDEWITASDHKLSWKLVDKEKDADIVCTWVGNKATFQKHKFAEQGETELKLGSPDENNGRMIQSATIQICTINLFGLVPLKKADIMSVCRHEAGHSLGLYGHSPHMSDVMFPAKFSAVVLVPVPVTISTEKRLSKMDKATLRHLYASYPQRFANASNAAN